MNFKPNKIHIKPQGLIFFLIIILFCFCLPAFSQETKRVDILNADFLESDESIAKDVTRLVGNVNIRHENILMWCDSAYTYAGTNKVDAFGNVHILQGDTLNLYAEKIFYDGDISFAQAIGNVKLENKSTTLFTDTLDYDLDANIAYYNNFGKIIDSTNVLTSIIGEYFIDDDMAHFYKEVEGYNEKYTLTSDTLHYNTKTGIFFIEGPTIIRDSTNTLYAEDGWYDTETGEAELFKNPVVSNEKQQLKASVIKYNDADGYSNATGAVQLEDFESHVLITGNYGTYSKSLEIATITDSAVFMSYSETNIDTLFIHADTLRAIPDEVEGKRIVMAFHGVRFFRSDLQGICDSLVYFSKDSLVQLHYLPVIWNDINQLSAEYIEMQQFPDAPNELRLVNNSFIISEQETDKYNQIKGKNMVGYIVKNELNNIEVDGNGETLYYVDEKGDIFALNKAVSSNISIRFKEGKVNKIAFLKPTEGVFNPLEFINNEETTLRGFEWKINQRPLSKQDIFRHDIAQNNSSAQENIQETIQENTSESPKYETGEADEIDETYEVNETAEADEIEESPDAIN